MGPVGPQAHGPVGARLREQRKGSRRPRATRSVISVRQLGASRGCVAASTRCVNSVRQLGASTRCVNSAPVRQLVRYTRGGCVNSVRQLGASTRCVNSGGASRGCARRVNSKLVRQGGASTRFAWPTRPWVLGPTSLQAFGSTGPRGPWALGSLGTQSFRGQRAWDLGAQRPTGLGSWNQAPIGP